MRKFTRFANPACGSFLLFLFLSALAPSPAYADDIVNISSTAGLTLTGSPLNFSFNYDATTSTAIGAPVIDFKGMVFTFSPASLVPLDFVFNSGINEIIIGDIGEFPQPGINGFPGVGTYPGVLVGYGSPTPTFAAFNGSVVVSAVPEPGVLTLLAAGFLLAPVLPRRRGR